MRKALPAIAEDADSLKQRLRHERDGRKKPRLQMLYLLASGRAQTRLEVTQLLGVHRNTIGYWLRRYEGGGLEALLDIHIPAGKPLSLPPKVLAAIEQVLQQPAGVASYEALRQWVRQTYHLEVNYITRSTPSSGRGSRRSLRSRAPATQKNPDAIPTFQASCGERLQEVIPPENTRPVRVFSQDESRVGLLTVRRRRLTACGVQPVGLIQHTFAWFYIY